MYIKPQGGHAPFTLDEDAFAVEGDKGKMTNSLVIAVSQPSFIISPQASPHRLVAPRKLHTAQHLYSCRNSCGDTVEQSYNDRI